MDKNIAIIVPNKVIAETSKNVVSSLGFSYPVYSSDRKEAKKIAKKLILEGTKVIITMGITADFIRENTGVLVLELQYTGVEFKAVIEEGLKHSNKVAVFGSKSLTYLMEKVITSTYDSIKIFNIIKGQSIEEKTEEILDQGFDVVIGGTPTVEVAKKRGKIGLSPNIDKKMVESALNNAIQILELKLENERSVQPIQRILNSTKDALIVANKFQDIIFVNTKAESILNISKANIKNESINNLFKINNKTYNSIINKDKFEFYIKDNKLYVTASPILTEGEFRGVVFSIKEVRDVRLLEEKIKKECLFKDYTTSSTFSDIIGNDKEIIKAKKIAKKYAKYDGNIFIKGEFGTNKKIFAEAIHNYGDRLSEPFIHLNCLTFSEDGLEKELFGAEYKEHESNNEIGVLELANNGTIFLENIEGVSKNIQTRLLYFLEDKRNLLLERRIRIITSSKTDILKLIKNDKFYSDLYYKLNILELSIPNLEERKEEIPLLIKNTIQKKNRTLKTKINGIEQSCLNEIFKIKFSGNINELENIIERMMILSETSLLTLDTLKTIGYFSETSLPKETSLLGDYEIIAINEALNEVGGNKKEAAKKLGISPTTLWRKRKKYEGS